MPDIPTDHDSFTVELVVRRRSNKRRTQHRVDIVCSPKVSEAAEKELEGCLPMNVVAAMPPGLYAFRQSSLTGFSILDHPARASVEVLSTVGIALFPAMKFCHARLVILFGSLADEDAVGKAVDAMYETAIGAAAQARTVAGLRPGFLKIDVGTNPSAFVPSFERGFDPSKVDVTEGYAHAVVGTNGTTYSQRKTKP